MFDPDIILKGMGCWIGLVGMVGPGMDQGCIWIVLDLELMTLDPFGFISRNHKDQSCNHPKLQGPGLPIFHRYIKDYSFHT